MVLSINSPTNTIITIVSDELNAFIASPGSYIDIDIQIFLNSTTDSTTETYSSTSLITGATNVRTSGGTETIVPAFFDGTEFEQGVYHVLITLTSEEEILTDEGCLYIEDGLKCDVDEHLLDESVNILTRVLNGLKYNSLISAAECPCKCDKKIEIYNDLIDLSNTCQGC